MIQRIQTVYLAVAAILLTISAFIPWVVYIVDESEAGRFSILHVAMDGAVFTVPVGVLVLGSVILSVVAMFLFGNRQRQMLIARLSAVLSVLTFAVFALLHFLVIDRLQEAGTLSISYSFVVIIPLLAAVLQWLAFKAVKSDDEKIRSVDRLR